jgi:RNA-directed DNA polymerase
MIEASPEEICSTKLSPCIDFDRLIEKENIYWAWENFRKGKLNRKDVTEFWLNLEKNLNGLYHDLALSIYRHGEYNHFVLQETKKRDIYVAGVRDRIVHQLLADYLKSIYSKLFYRYSCSSQKGKGVSFAREYALKTIRRLNYGNSVFVGKMDVKKYFQNVDRGILLNLLRRRIRDEKILNLCKIFIEPRNSPGSREKRAP